MGVLSPAGDDLHVPSCPPVSDDPSLAGIWEWPLITHLQCSLWVCFRARQEESGKKRGKNKEKGVGAAVRAFSSTETRLILGSRSISTPVPSCWLEEKQIAPNQGCNASRNQ